MKTYIFPPQATAMEGMSTIPGYLAHVSGMNVKPNKNMWQVTIPNAEIIMGHFLPCESDHIPMTNDRIMGRMDSIVKLEHCVMVNHTI